jgi:CheY-like chemotaxis protein
MRALRKVLVVDDDPVIAKSFDRVLSTRGYAVITADNGADALKKMATEEYDVVYTDIRMPGMSGLEVAERIKAQQPWTPVVIITGYGSEENQRRATAAGVAGFLHKPLSPDMIEGSAIAALASVVVRETESKSPAEPATGGAANNVATVLAARFTGLAFIVAFPVVALASLAWLGLRAAGKHDGIRTAAQLVKNIALLLVSPFIAIAYMAAMPMVGFYALTTLGRKTADKDAVKTKAGRVARKVGFVLASPLIAVVSLLAFPFVGLGALVWFAVRKTGDSGAPSALGRMAKRVGGMIAAPFIGLAYILLLPIVAMVMLVWFGGRAWILGPTAK